MDSDSDSYFEENSDKEEVAAPLHINLELNLEESPKSPPPGPPSPAPAPPALIPAGELSPVWELPDDGTNFMNFSTPADVLELRHWAAVTRQRITKKAMLWRSPYFHKTLEHSSLNTTVLDGKLKFCGQRRSRCFFNCWLMLLVMQSWPVITKEFSDNLSRPGPWR